MFRTFIWPLDFTRDRKPEPEAQLKAAVASAAVDQSLSCPSTQKFHRDWAHRSADQHAAFYEACGGLVLR